ncbi:MAG: ATP/GTP-binding protein [Xenococcaceae cyanobacterium MO_207.B15]|nr:ATP/GTP-binding protein [Xenococcaceae cyanobacterium MO_207.B15]MDJ0747573.1 ATP/GTP-binding protein [Xenococcaceae cyanobacterium MO_167.B27]
MEIFKIAVTGNVGAGKTTFIRTISEIEVVDTERRTTDETASWKKTTTVAFDFGRLTLNSDQVVYIYGTPGQSRFDFMWDIIINQANAYVLLVAAHRPQDFRGARRILAFMNQRVQIPMVIGLTHMDCEGAWEEDDIALALGFKNLDNCPPIINVNADVPNSVAQCLITLLEQLIPVPVA